MGRQGGHEECFRLCGTAPRFPLYTQETNEGLAFLVREPSLSHYVMETLWIHLFNSLDPPLC